MIAHKKKFTLGLAMLISFFAVLTIFFTPIFGGLNGLDYLDGLYNSISKGSAYYIPKLKDEAKAFNGNAVELTFAMASPTQAQQTSQLFMKVGGHGQRRPTRPSRCRGTWARSSTTASPTRTSCTRTTARR